MADRTELGLLLQRIRTRLGGSLTLMAAKVGMTRSYLSAIELGKRRPPLDFADKIVRAYSLTHEEREALYRLCARDDKDNIHREVLISVINSALADYDDRFLLSLGIDIVHEEGQAGPIPTEVALGFADACDDDNSRLVRLSPGEVGLLSSLLEDHIEEQKSGPDNDMLNDLDVDTWLEIQDFRMHDLRQSSSLYQKLTGHKYASPEDESEEDYSEEDE